MVRISKYTCLLCKQKGKFTDFRSKTNILIHLDKEHFNELVDTLLTSDNRGREDKGDMRV